MNKDLINRLNKLRRTKKILPLKEITDSSAWKDITFIEGLIDDAINLITYYLQADHEKAKDLKALYSKLTEKIQKWMQRLNFPQEYNGLVFYYLHKISEILSVPSSLHTRAWSHQEVEQLYSSTQGRKVPPPSNAQLFEQINQYVIKDKFAAEGNYSGVPDKEVKKQLNEAVNRFLQECGVLIQEGNLNQRKFNTLSKRLSKQLDDTILELDSEDKERFYSVLEEIAAVLGYKQCAA